MINFQRKAKQLISSKLLFTLYVIMVLFDLAATAGLTAVK